MLHPLGTNAVIAHEAIHRLSVSGLPQLEFLREVAARVGSVVPYDAGAWLTADPATLLQTGAFIQGMGEGGEAVHLRYADNEMLTPDFMKLTDVARLSHPVVTLRDATDGDLTQLAPPNHPCRRRHRARAARGLPHRRDSLGIRLCLPQRRSARFL